MPSGRNSFRSQEGEDDDGKNISGRQIDAGGQEQQIQQQHQRSQSNEKDLREHRHGEDPWGPRTAKRITILKKNSSSGSSRAGPSMPAGPQQQPRFGLTGPKYFPFMEQPRDDNWELRRAPPLRKSQRMMSLASSSFSSSPVSTMTSTLHSSSSSSLNGGSSVIVRGNNNVNSCSSEGDDFSCDLCCV